MKNNNFKGVYIWLAQISAVVSLVTIVFIQSKFVFESGNDAGKLVLFSLLTGILAFIFGVLSLPRWQGFVSLAIVIYVAYSIFVSPSLYALS